MDLLFSKYASPFDYLQGLMDIGNLLQGINYIFSQENERKLWELYLHSFPSKSFEDWKKDITSNKVKPVELSQKEVVLQVNKSQSILNTFQIS